MSIQLTEKQIRQIANQHNCIDNIDVLTAFATTITSQVTIDLQEKYQKAINTLKLCKNAMIDDMEPPDIRCDWSDIITAIDPLINP